MERNQGNQCSNNCGNNADRCVPFFDVQNTMMHYNWANRRMLIALITVCATFIVTILVFVHGYTVREKNWLDTLGKLTGQTVTQEVQSGVHEQSGP